MPQATKAFEEEVDDALPNRTLGITLNDKLSIVRGKRISCSLPREGGEL
jgi:hypothetical protein